MKNRPVGAELFHADERTDRQTDRQTDMRKLIVTFRNFAKSYFRLKKGQKMSAKRNSSGAFA